MKTWMLCEQCYIFYHFIKYNMFQNGKKNQTNKIWFDHPLTGKNWTLVGVIKKNAHRNNPYSSVALPCSWCFSPVCLVQCGAASCPQWVERKNLETPPPSPSFCYAQVQVKSLWHCWVFAACPSPHFDKKFKVLLLLFQNGFKSCEPLSSQKTSQSLAHVFFQKGIKSDL